MAATMPDQPATRFAEIVLSRPALRALAEATGRQCGPLAVLGRLDAGAEPADATALQAFLTGLPEPFHDAPAVLVDPHLTIGLALADGQSQTLGQYAWPDPAGLLPGFRILVGNEDLRLAGPVTPEDVAVGLASLLQLGGVLDPGLVRVDLSADQFWALAALVDAGIMVAAARRAAHVTGAVAGVRWAEIAVCWRRSLTTPDLGWATTFAAALLPEALPTGGEPDLRQALADLEEAGLVTLLTADDPTDPLGDVYVAGSAIQSLWDALATAVLFGLTVQRQTASTVVERAVVLGWRTVGGLFLADLTRLPDGSAVFLRLGPGLLEDLLPGLLGLDAFADGPPPDFQPTWTRERVLAALADRTATPPPAPPAAALCPSCRQPVSPGARFCKACGRPVPATPPPPAAAAEHCPSCGQPVSADARFCRGCGRPVTA